ADGRAGGLRGHFEQVSRPLQRNGSLRSRAPSSLADMLSPWRPHLFGLALLAVAIPDTATAAPVEAAVRPASADPDPAAGTMIPEPPPTSTTPTGPSAPPASESGANAPENSAAPNPSDPATAPGTPASDAANSGGTEPPGLAEQMLGPSVNQHPEKRPSKPLPTDAEAAEAEDAAVAAAYRDMFRPSSNPGRFHGVARAQYGFGSSFDGTLSGRTGGIQLDLGQSFNFIGYAATLRGEGGEIHYGTEG